MVFVFFKVVFKSSLEMKLHLQLISSPPLQVPPLEGAQVESRVHEPLQLVQVSGLGSCGSSGCRVSPNIPNNNGGKTQTLL